MKQFIEVKLDHQVAAANNCWQTLCIFVDTIDTITTSVPTRRAVILQKDGTKLILEDSYAEVMDRLK